nr:MAG TPA: hypothetical protein [Crassvirales sp.]
MVPSLEVFSSGGVVSVVELVYLVNSTDSSPRVVPALINLSIKLGVPLVPSHICHPSGIF